MGAKTSVAESVSFVFLWSMISLKSKLNSSFISYMISCNQIVFNLHILRKEYKGRRVMVGGVWVPEGTIKLLDGPLIHP